MTDPNPPAAVRVLAAGSAGCVADLVTFPLDTAKVRLQVRHLEVPQASVIGFLSVILSFFKVLIL